MVKYFSISLIAFFAALLTTPSYAADRIVSIGGSITEILFELGLQDKIVAVDTTSLYPPETQEMPNVGYVRALSAEPIIALNPKLILYQDDAGPPETIEHLKSTGIQMVMISDEPSEEGVFQKIDEVSQAVGMQEMGEQLIGNLKSKLDELHDFLSYVDQPASVLFILAFDQGTAMVAGKETGADGIISLAKGENAVSKYNSYKPLSAESILELDPDFILTTKRAISAFNSKDDVLSSPTLSLTRAAQNKNLIVMDGLLLLGFGPRLAEAANELAQALYKEKR
ncbi:MAG: ABC transporter substrate-binding protein [Pseudomonadota bacterium]